MMSRQKILTIVALLTIGGHASQSAAFSTHDGYRLKPQTNFRAIDKRTPLNRLLPLAPLHSISRCHPQKQKYLTTTCMAATAQMPPMADLAVRLDSPILSPNNRSSELWKFVVSALVSQVFRTALITFAIALAIALVTKLSSSFVGRLNPLTQSLSHGYRVSRGRLLRIFDGRRNVKNNGGTPMEFDGEEMDGWGVCTLSSREAVGRSQFVKYEFDLPRKDHTLDLLSGQQVELCYLDKRDHVAKGNYYLYSPPTSKGSFSLILPKNKRTYTTGADEEDKISTDLAELGIGDEVALKPGPETFQYHGQYFPITDMLHFVAGEGIAPVINQVKSVLPSGSSSLKLVKVVWMNQSEKDFDVGQSTLEDDYYKYFKKLAVSCIVEDFEKNELYDNDEIVANVPRFNPGTMVVISGPQLFVSKAKKFLRDMEYPDECICIFSSD